jgi:glutamate synthase domain-containing protein 3
MIKHMTYTGSLYAGALLADWHDLQRRIVKVMPREYKRALAEQVKVRVDSRREEVATLVVTGVAAKVAREHATA